MNESYVINDFLCYPQAGFVALDSDFETKKESERLLKERKPFNEDVFGLKPLNFFMSNKLGVFITSECQLRCIYCYYDSDSILQKKGKVISFRQIDFIVEKVFESSRIISIASKRMEKVEITISGGGEPTLHWDVFCYFVNELRKKSIETGIPLEIELVTNGILSPEKVDFIIENIDMVTLSYDGTPKIQRFQRIGSALQHELIESFLKRLSDVGFDFVVRATVLSTEDERLVNICEFLFSKYNGLRHIVFEPVAHSGRAENFESEYRSDFLSEYIKAYEYVSSHFPKKSISCSLFPSNLTPSICSAWLGRTPWIDAEGYLMPCNERMSHEKYAIGKIGLNGGFDWYDTNKPSYVPGKGVLSKECNECIAYYFCRGGCPIVFQRNEKGCLCTESSKKACNMVRRYWTEVFSNLSKGEMFMGFVPEVLFVNPKTGKPSIIGVRK